MTSDLPRTTADRLAEAIRLMANAFRAQSLEPLPVVLSRSQWDMLLSEREWLTEQHPYLYGVRLEIASPAAAKGRP